MASPNFTINGSSCPPEKAVAYGASVTLALLSTSGVNSVAWSFAGTDNASTVAPAITLGGSPLGASASFTMVADPTTGLGASLIIKCVVNGGRDSAGQVDPTLTKTALVGVLNVSGTVPLAVGEQFERDSVQGWTTPMNRLLAGPDTVAHGALQPSDGIHGIVSGLGPYASSTARQAQSGLTAADLNKVAYQVVGGVTTLWLILAVSGGTATWLQINTTADTLVSPGSILGSEPAWWLDGAAGHFTDVGAGVCSQWADSAVGAHHATFGVGARPTIQPTGLNGKPTLKFTSSQFGGNAGYVAPAPGTTLSYFFAIARVASVASGTGIFLGTGANNLYRATAQITDFNGASTGTEFSSTIAANTWYRIEYLRSNANTDYAVVNGIAGTLGNAGNAANTGFTLNANNAGGQIDQWEYAEIFQWTGAVAPDSGKRAALAAYSLAKWGV